MHLFINTFITNTRYFPSAYKELSSSRGYSKLEVFEYAIRSYAHLPLSSASIYFKLDDEFRSSRKSLIDYIRRTLPCKVDIHEYRINELTTWMSAIHRCPDGKIILFSCNDDHIFYSTNRVHLCRHLDDFGAVYKRERYLSSAISHWQEMVSHLSIGRLLGLLYPYDEFAPDVRPRVCLDTSILEHSWLTNYRSTIGVQLITKELLLEIFSSDANFPVKDFRRSDEANAYGGTLRDLPWFTLIPRSEMFRHFDAYSHNGIPHSVVPPLPIVQEGQCLYFGGSRVMGELFCNPYVPLYAEDTRIKCRTVNESDHYFFGEYPLVWGRVRKVAVEQYPDEDYFFYTLYCRARELLCQRAFGAGLVLVNDILLKSENREISQYIRWKAIILAALSVRYNPIKNYIYLSRRYMGLLRRFIIRISSRFIAREVS